MVEYPLKEQYNLQDFRDIIGILRHPGGCPWDGEQTHASIRRNLLEEAYECAEGIDTGNQALLEEELGDVLMQVLFHASIEEDAGHFDIDDVADHAVKKLIFRHPHVFGRADGDNSQPVPMSWDELKRQEKQQDTYTDTLNSVARTLPALWRAEKVLNKAAKAGFDWETIQQAQEKVREETAEVDEALAGNGNLREEIGDLLFAAVNVARFAGIDPEDALNEATEKFIARFERVEQASPKDLMECSVPELVTLWKKAKEADKV